MSSLPDRFTCSGCSEERTDLMVANDLGYFCSDCEDRAFLDVAEVRRLRESKPLEDRKR